MMFRDRVMYYGTFSGSLAAAVNGFDLQRIHVRCAIVRLHQRQAISQRSHLAAQALTDDELR